MTGCCGKICTVLFEVFSEIFIRIIGIDSDLYTQFAALCLKVYLSLISFPASKRYAQSFCNSSRMLKQSFRYLVCTTFSWLQLPSPRLCFGEQWKFWDSACRDSRCGCNNYFDYGEFWIIWCFARNTVRLYAQRIQTQAQMPKRRDSILDCTVRNDW